MRSRYSRWDGTQDPFGLDVQVGDVLDEITEDILSGTSPSEALRNLLRQGMHGVTRGLDDLARRVRSQRRKLAESLNMDGPLTEIADQLNEILSEERQELASRNTDDARLRETELDTLPSQPAARLKELMEYRFASESAQHKFDELVESIRKQILDSYFGQLSGAMQNVTPDDVARVREMVAELNEMIAKRERSEDYDFEGFMQRFGDMFPENPSTLDELLDALAKRMAAMSRLLASMSPEQRRQLMELANAVLDDADLAFEMEMLGQELRDLMPQLPWDQMAPGHGDGSGSLSQAVGAIEQMSDLEELEEALAGQYAGASIDDVDEQKLRDALGADAVNDLHRLKQFEKALEEAGIVSRNQGRLEMTARGIRRIGERALVKVFEELKKERAGQHQSRDVGGPAEPTGATRRWLFGDMGQLDVQKTVFNSVVRSPLAQRGSVKLTPDDFELIEAESRTRTATALLLDLSFSMPLRGHWVPAKRMALALHALIEGKYPQDHLYLIGFNSFAWKMDPSELTATGSIERVYGTNMQHAFLLARRLLAEHPRSNKQVIMVTDGEPTAHLVDGFGGEPDFDFNWPPTPETIHKTLAEAVRLANADITLNIFMLEDEPGLTRFMDELARRTGGRVFQTAGSDIGHYVLRDFVRRRS